MRSTITTPPPRFASALPVVDSLTDCRSNPIAHRLRRKRQRLPPSLLNDNASDRAPRATPRVRLEAFPVKASDISVPAERRDEDQARFPLVFGIQQTGSA